MEKEYPPSQISEKIKIELTKKGLSIKTFSILQAENKIWIVEISSTENLNDTILNINIWNKYRFKWYWKQIIIKLIKSNPNEIIYISSILPDSINFWYKIITFLLEKKIISKASFYPSVNFIEPKEISDINNLKDYISQAKENFNEYTKNLPSYVKINRIFEEIILHKNTN